MGVTSVGASAEERARPFPGDGLLEASIATWTHGVTIAAPPRAVWPWLAQMGAGRAGWYSWDAVDNGGRPSAREIDARWERIALGDVLPAGPGVTEAFVVERLEPGRDLVLGVPHGAGGLRSTWEFLLDPLPGGRTRLLVRSRVGTKGWMEPLGAASPRAERVYRALARLPRGPVLALARAGHRVMQARQLRGIRRRAESRRSPSAGPAGPAGPAREGPAPGQALRLPAVAETLLVPLYVRALESGRPDALLVDARAVALLEAHREAFERVERIRMDDGDRAALVLRNRELDRIAARFLAENAPAVVVHVGCGLDSRFERVDDGRADWYDLDLPEVIALRRSLLGDEERGRHHLLATSVLDAGWMEEVSRHRPRAVLFLAEGVFTYLAEPELRGLVRALRDRFPGSELAFDAFSPLLVRANNLRLRLSGSPLDVRYRWGLRRGRDLETWGEGIRLLEEWFPLDRPEPRLARYRWLRHVRPLARVLGVYRYRLG